MSNNNIDSPIYTPDIVGGDTFILEETDNTVYSMNTLVKPPFKVETIYTSKWTKDEKLSREGHKEFKERVKEWNQ